MSSGEDMEVEVRDLLAGVEALVGDEAVAGLRDAEVAGYARRNFETAGGSGDEGRVLVREGLNVLVWYDEDVRGRLRVDVAYGEDRAVVVDLLGGMSPPAILQKMQLGSAMTPFVSFRLASVVLPLARCAFRGHPHNPTGSPSPYPSPLKRRDQTATHTPAVCLAGALDSRLRGNDGRGRE